MSDNLEQEEQKEKQKEEEEKSFIILPHSCYDSKDISNEELTILALLHRNYNSATLRTLCSIQMLIDYMHKDSRVDRKIVKTIKDSIVSLMSKKYKYKYNNKKDKKEYIIEKVYITELKDIHYNKITINDIKDKNYLFYVGLTTPENQFMMINNIDIDNIFNYIKGVSLNKFALIRYFIACKRVIQNEANFGFITQSKLKSLISDSKTIQRYNKILQNDLNLIRYCNDYLTPDKHYCSTFIGLYDNTNNFNEQLKFYVDSQGLIPTDKTKANEKRSSKQKINNISKKINNDTIIAEKDIEIEKLKAEVEKYKSMQYIDYKKQEEKIIQEDKEIIELTNDFYGFNQYEDNQMNPDDIMPDIINNIDDDEIFEDIPESLKLTKQFQDELKEIDINDI